MSRSKKKIPKSWVCSCKSKTMKWWKSRIKLPNGEIGNYSSYKKYNDIWCSPSDGKMWREGEKKFRK
jgi:hypothetical protein